MTTITRAVRPTTIARAVLCAGAFALPVIGVQLGAQQSLTRLDAIRTALGASARVTSISVDTLAAAARLRSAREYPNPSFTASYSRAVPQTHFSMEVPLDLPPIRGARVRAAESGRESARYSFLAARASIELGVDTMYTVAQGAALRAALSQSTAMDAAQLLSDTKKRRDAGDASDLDVNLAEVAAGQAANVANADSLDAIDARLELQTAMGTRGDTVVILISDSLQAPERLVVSQPAAPASSPTVAAANAALAAAQQTLLFQRRNAYGVPAFQFGAEGRDPTGAEKGILPTFGIVLPIPLFNRNGGEIAAASAEVTRAQADLVLARQEAAAQLARAYRMRDVAEGRIARDGTILDAATKNVTMSERAFAEGEMAISNILEARRAQRDAQQQFVTDLVAANVGAGIIRVLTENGALP